MTQVNEEYIGLLLKVLKIDSVLGNESEVADVIINYFKQFGIESQRIEFSANRNQLIATIDSGSPGRTLALCGHMDVVRTGTDEWIYPPFDGTIADDHIHGRGTVDMKSGLVAMAVAFSQFSNKQKEFNGKLKFIATVGEESNSIGAKQMVEEGILGNIDAMIIGEPTNNQLCLSHKGALWFKVKTTGKISHGSMPELGVNAIERMFQVIPKLKRELNELIENDKVLGKTTWSINRIEGGQSTNIIPDYCSIDIDMRILPSQDIEELKENLKNLIEGEMTDKLGFPCSIEFVNEKVALQTEESNKFIHLTREVLSEIRGEGISLSGLSIYTDASEFLKSSYKYPIVILGPGETQLAHTTNENILIQDFYDAITIYAQIIDRYFEYK